MGNEPTAARAAAQLAHAPPALGAQVPVRVGRAPDGGALFSVLLPLADAANDQIERREAKIAAQRQGRRLAAARNLRAQPGCAKFWHHAPGEGGEGRLSNLTRVVIRAGRLYLNHQTGAVG